MKARVMPVRWSRSFALFNRPSFPFFKFSLQRMSSCSQMPMHAGRPIYHAINKKITESLKPWLLDIQDESPNHRGHAAMKDVLSSETHFNVTIVSDTFENQSRVNRHRMVYKMLDEEFQQGLHALRLQTFTKKEFEAAKNSES